jgi:hypothetical protein
MPYASQGINDKKETNKIREVTSYRTEDYKLVVSMNKERPMSKSPLYSKYDIQKYDLHPNYASPA